MSRIFISLRGIAALLGRSFTVSPTLPMVSEVLPRLRMSPSPPRFTLSSFPAECSRPRNCRCHCCSRLRCCCRCCCHFHHHFLWKPPYVTIDRSEYRSATTSTLQIAISADYLISDADFRFPTDGSMVRTLMSSWRETSAVVAGKSKCSEHETVRKERWGYCIFGESTDTIW
ncbi:hypothetical protein BDV96DRAFT_566138 [Lophiotrema nucula]|uniref:Secreted protein n=1 Tax=Lophiotrema nucula TaxID=690887 RepID=A0A6A5ZQ90_9PLEO|nr:hypothetical protein BDV96DRAFT_566138 [Lophiotrema nucula]